MPAPYDFYAKPFGDKFVVVSKSDPDDYCGDDAAMWLFHKQDDAQNTANYLNTPTPGERLNLAFRTAMSRVLRRKR